MRGKTWLTSLGVLLILLAGLAIKGVLVQPPAVPDRPAAGEFDHARALARLQRILGDERPHPVDSQANDAVRDRLIAELRAIGLMPRVHDTMDCSAMPKSRAVSCSRVRNVIATVGSGPGRHVLLNSHYDSTPTGPGAADDGLGVAVMLEVAALLQKSRPARPVSLLFNEGEEFGLNGASAFVARDPLAKQVDSLVNIEARGVSGPALMFETSDPNGAAIRLFGNAARRPFANSLSMDFAKLIPNTTDVVEFRPAGWTMLNYAIIGNETRYHTPGDTVAALDRRSLHHAGSEVLAVTRALAGASPESSEAVWVFTDVGGRLFVSLPLPLAAVALGLLILAAVVLARRKRALGPPLLLAGGMAVSGIATAVVLALIAGLFRSGDFYRAYPLVIYVALYAALLTAMASVWWRWGRGIDRQRMRAAAWLLVLLAGGAASVALPGASIFFLIAPAIALLAMAVEQRWRLAAPLLIAAALVVHVVMLAQLLALIEMLLIDGPLCVVAPLGVLAVLPVLVELDASTVRLPAGILAGVTFVLWAAAMILPRASEARPAAFTIDYFRDGPRAAHWAVASKQAPLPRDYPGEWRKAVLPYSGRTRWVSKAPMLEVPRPSARIVRVVHRGGGRRVWLALSPGGADAIAIRFDEEAAIRALGLPGRAIAVPEEGEPEKASLRCSGRSCEGFVIEVQLAARKPVIAELFSTRFALPPEGRALVAARPANAHPQYGPDSSVRLHRVRF